MVRITHFMEVQYPIGIPLFEQVFGVASVCYQG